MESSPRARTIITGVVVVGRVAAVVWLLARPPIVAIARGDVVLVKHSRPSPAGNDAVVSGRLSVDDRGCIGLDGIVAVFPFTTRLIDDDPIVIRFRGDTKRLGDSIDGSGGYGLGPSHLDLLDRCSPPPGDEVPAFNP